MVIAVTAAGVAPASASQRPETSRVESTYQGMTGFFSDCPTPPEVGTCIGYSVNAVTLREEVGRREYHHELVWVDAYKVTITATEVIVDRDNPVMTSGHDNIAPHYGGLPASVHIEGASSGRVRGKVTLKGTDGKTHRAVLDVRVSGGTAQTSTSNFAPSALCPAGFAMGQSNNIESDTATTAGTMSVDGKQLAPANVPKVAEAQVSSHRFTDLHAGFNADEQDATQRLFSRLVTPGDGSEDTRRRVERTDLAGVPGRVVDAFVSARLLTAGRDRTTRRPTVEVAHEVLLQSWPRIRSWLADDRAWLRELRALSGAAGQWERGEKDNADLYRGARLAVVEELANAHAGALTDTESSFLARSLEERSAGELAAKEQLDVKVRQNRRLRQRLAALAVFAAAAVIAGAVALAQRQQAHRQQAVAVQQRSLAETQTVVAQNAADQASQSATKAEQASAAAVTAKTGSQLTTLASQSLSLRSSQRDLAALLAVESWRRRHDAGSKSALFGTFTADPSFLGYLPVKGASETWGEVVPGTDLVVATGSVLTGSITAVGPMQLIDVVTGKIVRTLDPLTDEGSDNVTFTISTGGRYAAVADFKDTATGRNRHIAVYDLTTGHRVSPVIALTAFYDDPAINADGTIVVAPVGPYGEAAVYDARTGDVVARIPAETPPPSVPADYAAGAVAFGPDGRLYVGSIGEHLRVFSADRFVQVDDITVPLYSTVGILRFSADGQTLVSRGVHYDPANGYVQRGAIARIDLATKRTIWQVSGDDYGYGECAAFAFDEPSGRLWCGNYFGLIKERFLSTGALTGHTLANQRGWNGSLDVMETSRGLLLIGFGNNFGAINRWRIDGGGALARRVAGDHTIAGQFPDNTTLLVSSPLPQPPPFNASYTLWDAVTDTERPGLPKMLYATVTGTKVSGVFADDFRIGTFDPVTGVRTAFPVDLSAVPTASAGTPDGSRIALGYGDGRVVLYNVATGSQLFAITLSKTPVGQRGAAGIAMTPDGLRIYVAGNGLWLFDKTGKQLAYNTDSTIGSLGAGPPGRVVAGHFDGTLNTYDPDTLQVRSPLPGSIGLIGFLIASDDGSTLLGHSNGNQSLVSLYDLAVPSRCPAVDKVAAVKHDPRRRLESGLGEFDPRHASGFGEHRDAVEAVHREISLCRLGQHVGIEHVAAHDHRR